MRRGFRSLALLAALLPASPALATVGGPTFLEVLGWSREQRRVYGHELPMDAADSFGGVYSIPIDHPEKPEPYALGRYTGEQTADDPLLARRLAELQARLSPLKVGPAAVLPLHTEIVKADSIGIPWSVPRFVVRAKFAWKVSFEVTTYWRPEVARARVYSIPGTRFTLVVLAFTGDPGEGGYETWVPVLIGEEEQDVRKVEWRPIR